MNELILDGCTAEPLMGYLKALGVLRLVSEQLHAEACGCWRDGVFVLQTKAGREELVTFFREKYQPTPIVVPWSGGDFFEVSPKAKTGKVSKTPSASAIIEAFLVSSSPRLAGFRCVLQETLATMQAVGVTKKAHIEGTSNKKTKARFLAKLRSTLPDHFVNWLDAASQLANDSLTFNALLGSGGGSDGNTHFSDNFMQSLWDCFPDFDEQRSRTVELPEVDGVLFATAARGLRPNRTASLFDSGAVGGPNAGIGFERDALLNPWNFILALEGTICFAGAVVKRQQANHFTSTSFPFSVRMTATGFGSAVDAEQGQNEIWMPLWKQSLSYRELEYLLENGRCEVGRRASRTGLDFARAVAGLGVDAGIDAFMRYAIVKGRVGGDNYNTAVFVGLFSVREAQGVGLLDSLDWWLEPFRLACRSKKQGAKIDPPPRFPTALRRIESTIFDFCKYGGQDRLAEILAALGNAERELALGDFPPDKRRIRPLGGLNAGWLDVADDDTAEFRLARSVVFLNNGIKNTGSIRRNIEPVEAKGDYWGWSEGGGHVVWNGGDLCRNLGAVLIRRMMDAEKKGEPAPPLGSSFPARLTDIAAFLRGEVDGARLEELIWGLSLVRPGKKKLDSEPVAELPRAYALLKLTLLQGTLAWERAAHGASLQLHPFHEDKDNSSGVKVKPERAALAQLRAGKVQTACETAARRLRSSGFSVIGRFRADGSRRNIDWDACDVPPNRLLAALIFPVADGAVNQLAELVLRPTLENPA